jgi:transposase
LPKYSPDLNDIEHDFSALKSSIMYSPVNTYIDEIIRNYYASIVSFLFKIIIASRSALITDN